jgi:hypothetical protein
MTARMEKVREALAELHLEDARRVRALSEVEEWETRLAHFTDGEHTITVGRAWLKDLEDQRDSLKHLHALDHSLADQWLARAEAAEAERDRLKAALDWHGSGRPSPEQIIGWYQALRADEKRYGPQ